MTMLPLVSALLLLAGQREHADTSQLALELRASEGTILVGQPTKVSILLTANGDMPVHPEAVRLLISSGAAFHEYASPTPGGTTAWIFPPTVGSSGPLELERTIDIVRSVDPLGNVTHAFALGAPGKYAVKARYDVGSGSQRLIRESNVVTITAKVPTGRDLELFETHLRSHPQIVSQWAAVEPPIERRVRELSEQYGDSPYLSAAQLGIWRRDLDRAIAPTLTHGQESAGARTKASALLHEIGGRSLPGPFEADRLLLVADAWVMLSDRAEAKRIYELVAERFPDSVGARKAEEWIRSDAEAQAAEQRIKQTP